MWKRGKISFAISLTQLIVIVLFVLNTDYGPDADATESRHNLAPALGGQDVNENPINSLNVVAIYGLMLILMTTGLSLTHFTSSTFQGIGSNLLFSLISLELSLSFQSFQRRQLTIDVQKIINAEWIALSMSITLSVLSGIASNLQLLIVTVAGTILSTINANIVTKMGAMDIGHVNRCHLFACWFGVSIATVIWFKFSKQLQFFAGKKLSTSPASQFNSIINVILMVVFWPSFVASDTYGDKKHRVMVNIYLSMFSAIVTSYVVATLLDSSNRFSVRVLTLGFHCGTILATGIAVFMIHPAGALMIGTFGASFGIVANLYLCPLWTRLTGYHDYHMIGAKYGFLSILSLLLAAFLSFGADEKHYKWTLYELFPLRAPNVNSSELEEIIVYFDRVQAGQGLSASGQCLIQLKAIFLTLIFAITSGLATGLIVAHKAFDAKDCNEIFDDATDWYIPTREHVHIGSDKHCEKFFKGNSGGRGHGKSSGQRKYRTMNDSAFAMDVV